MNEVQGQFHDVMVISELRGAYPNVPIAADVDYAALIANDPEPTFLTLPIGKVNVKSGNNRYYDEAWLTELMRQTLANKPVGLMGHMSDAERATAFKPEAVHWVGAVRDGDTLWGKAYLVGEARERVRRYKASGKSIATSIDAVASGTWDESLKAFRMDASTLRLNQIDLAPADRAGIADLARVPVLTTEMETEVPEAESEPEMDKLEVINGLTAEDARLLPKAVRDAILADVPPPPVAPEVVQAQELRAALGVDDKADLKAIVTEMRATHEKERKEGIARRIQELITDKEKGIKVEAARDIVQELVTGKNPQTIQEAEVAYNQVIESAPVKRLLAARVQEIMGPKQTTPVQGQQGTPKYFNIPSA